MSLEGQRLGEFEILSRLGQGGMGAVYKARQVSLERLVALKTLQGQFSNDEEFIARFRREAKAAASLIHTNLVQVYSAGESDGLHWFAMEYVEGESAQSRLKRKGRLDLTEAIAIATHIATALEYGWRKAHLIHRDIKPDNIFLSNDGEVKLGDLGLAKSVGVGDTQGLTMTGSSMGTPYYISPEQGQGKKDVDFRADIYSLGCTFYHLACGEPPYPGDTPLAVMMQHVTAPVPNLRDKLPACPQALAIAVLKMMAKNPAHRQQGYAEVLADLRRGYDELLGASVPNMVAVSLAPQPAPRPVSHEAPTVLFADLAAPPAKDGQFAIGGSKTPPVENRRSLKKPLALAAVVAILGIIAFFAFGNKEPQLTEAERAAKARIAQNSTQNPATKTAATPAAPLPADGWKPLFTDEEWKRTSPGGREFVDGRVRLLKVSARKPQPSADGAIRARIWFQEGSQNVAITARAKNQNELYKVNFRNGLQLSLGSVGADGHHLATLGSHTLPKPLKPGDKILLELRLQGDLISAAVDGTVVIQGRDTTYAGPGSWGILADDAWFESVEVQTPGTSRDIVYVPPDSAGSSATPGASRTPAPVASTAAVHEAVVFAGHRYQFVPGAMTWDEAKAKAASMGGHLATVTSKAENEWLYATFGPQLDPAQRSSSIWLGGSAEASGQPWKWVTSEPFTFTGWTKDEPDYATTKGQPVKGPFGISLKNHGQIGWFDDPVDRKNANAGFLIEWDDN